MCTFTPQHGESGLVYDGTICMSDERPVATARWKIAGRLAPWARVLGLDRIAPQGEKHR